MRPGSKIQPILVEVRDMPEFTIAYLRHVGPYAGKPGLFGRMFGRICNWAGPRGFLHNPSLETVCVYHDNPDITPQTELRISIGVTVPPETLTTLPVRLMSIPAGKYVSARFEILPQEFSAAWEYVLKEWMPANGYQPDDRPCYESYLNDPALHPEGICVVEIRSCIKPL